MHKKLWLKVLLGSSLFISGCGLYKIDHRREEPNNTVTYNEQIYQELNEVPKEDCIKMYTFFSGLSCYIQNVTNDDINTNDILNKTLFNAQYNYNWNRDKYPKITDIVSNELVKKGLDEPHKLNDKVKEKIIKDELISTFNEIAASIKKSIESK